MATRYSNKNIATQVATPVGTIIMVGKNGAPTGFLLCNGASLLRADYPELFAIIGTAWGAADGTHFNLPDLRGRMPRGRDNGAGRDPDAGGRTANATGGATGDNVGSVQAQATRKNGLTATGGTASLTGTTTFPNTSHTHGSSGLSARINIGGSSAFNVRHGSATFSSDRFIDGVANGGGGGSQPATFIQGSTDGPSANTSSVGISSTAAGLTDTDNETRPVNANVDFAIKY